MTIKLICFDMDGVLLDLCEVHRVALNNALKFNKNEPISNKEHYDTFNGLPTKVKLNLLKDLGRITEQDIEFLADYKQQLTLDAIMLQITPNLYTTLVLQHLKETGYKIALCTNSVRRTAEAGLEASQLTKYFDLVLSNEDVENSKPDPEIYIKAMTHFAVQPEETLILEDNFNGIAAARASGGHVLEIRILPQLIMVLDEVHRLNGRI